MNGVECWMNGFKIWMNRFEWWKDGFVTNEWILMINNEWIDLNDK